MQPRLIDYDMETLEKLHYELAKKFLEWLRNESKS